MAGEALMVALPSAPAGFVTVDAGVAKNDEGQPEWVDDFGAPIRYLVYADRAATVRLTSLQTITGTPTDALSPLTPAQAPEPKDQGRILGFVPDAYSTVWLVREGGYPWTATTVETLAAAADSPQAALDAQAAATDAANSADAAAQSATDAAADASTALTAVKSVQDTAATVDEVGLVQYHDYTTPAQTTGSVDVTVATVDGSRAVAWAALVWDGWTLAASDTDYWTFSLVARAKADGAESTIITKTTQVASGEPITAGRSWDLSVGSATQVALSLGDTIRLVGTKTGAPADMPRVYVLTMRLTPRR